MKKSILFLLAFCAGLSLASAGLGAFDGSLFGLSRAAAPAEKNAQDACRQVEVQLDEGYGVSRRETRLLCQGNP